MAVEFSPFSAVKNFPKSPV